MRYELPMVPPSYDRGRHDYLLALTLPTANETIPPRHVVQCRISLGISTLCRTAISSSVRGSALMIR
jgi:hypothetical protein